MSQPTYDSSNSSRDDYCGLDRPVVRDQGKAPRRCLISDYWGTKANDLPAQEG